MISLGERIRLLRKEKKLTQEELARNLGCTKQSIYRYEKGLSQMDTHILKQAADLFKVSTDYLLGISEESCSEHDINNNLSPTFYDEDYFWIFNDDGSIGAHTWWIGFTADGKEKRAPRPIIPDKTFKFCENLYGRPLVINTEEDMHSFFSIECNALIRSSIYIKFLPKVYIQ